MTTEQSERRRDQVLNTIVKQPEIAGRALSEFVIVYAVAFAFWTVAVVLSPPGMTFPLGAIGLLAFIVSTILVFAAPSHRRIHRYVIDLYRHYTDQPEYVHTMSNETTSDRQPEPESFVRRVASLPLIKWSVFGSGTDDSTQEFIEVKKAYRDSHAVERSDGTLVGAVRVTPANMATKDEDEWRTKVNRLARSLASKVHYGAQWFNTMRSVDYESRENTYRQRGSEYRSQAISAEEDGDDQTTLTRNVLTDICEERAWTVSVLQETTMTREYYFIVAVDPEDVVISVDDEGLAAVPILGKFVTAKRLAEREGSEEHLQEMVEKLEMRLNEVAELARSVDSDITAVPLSSSAFSKVLADYYRGDDVYEYEDFTSLVRQCPVPVDDEESGDPEHDLDYSHLTTDRPDPGNTRSRREAAPGVSASATAPDGGTVVGQDQEQSQDREHDRKDRGRSRSSTRGGGSDLSTLLREQISGDGQKGDERPRSDFGPSPDPEDRPDSDRRPDDDRGADDGEQGDDTDDQEGKEEGEDDDSEFSEIEYEPEALNNGATVGIVTDEDELEWRYQSLLSPDSINPSESPRYVVLDDDTYSTTLAIRDWPGRPPLGMLEPILNFDEPGVRATTSTHFQGLDVDNKRRELKSQVDAMEQKTANAEEKNSPFAERYRQSYEAARDIKESVEQPDTGLFESTTYIELRAPSPKLLKKAIRSVRTSLRELNADAKEMKYHQVEGYQTAAPLAKDDTGEEVTMTSNGLAALIPWTSENLIEPGGVEIGTHADRCEPTVLDLFSRSTGYNMGIFGKIGSGKTTTLKTFLLRHKIQNPETRMVLIDPVREFTGLCEIFDGNHVVIGGETPINPLEIEAVPEEKLKRIGESTPLKDVKRRGMTFIQTYYRLEDLDLTDKKGTWQKAIEVAFDRAGITEAPATHDRPSPTITDAIQVLEDMVNDPDQFVRDEIADDEESWEDRKETAIRILNNDISAFEEGGIYHHLTKPTELDISESDTLYLDLQRYEGEAKTGLMMQTLTSLVYQQAKRSEHPTIMAMDESHYMTKHSSDLSFLKQAIRHSRHYDLSMIFSTQSVGEFYGEKDTVDDENREQKQEDAQIIIDQMSVKIFHYLEEMDDTWAERFDLTDSEKEYIQGATPGKEEYGFSEALLKVDQKGCYPLRVEMGDHHNPCEFAFVQYDPSNHGENMASFLREQTDEWRWL
ncbi:VirB4 family type IV secretion system protein [Saliphagus infecundisoli]|uniref:Helicase HerA domain-containing protein n=1 Tax=Saliphagus infecundisoli TaxID=1849069 RepID=A0ABD5QH76_9EURY|nr:DUF87 domain-containing protein [Saliphagus infecundisoli]